MNRPVARRLSALILASNRHETRITETGYNRHADGVKLDLTKTRFCHVNQDMSKGFMYQPSTKTLVTKTAISNTALSKISS